MTKARSEQISLDDTPFYHCYSRCVRRAFLCGFDRETGEDFEHRKHWIVDRMKRLASVFCMDICAYAVMDNHYHVVLRVDVEEAEALSIEEVLQRWTALFSGNFLVNRYRSDERTKMSGAEIDKVHEIAGEWRHRLMNVSWFMRCLNEYIARMANQEDKCKGRFWEGRFKSQALLDDVAVLACMTYVDLNPVRAGVAETPESSDFTAIQERIEQHLVGAEEASRSSVEVEDASVAKPVQAAAQIDVGEGGGVHSKRLLAFIGDERIDQPKGINYSLEDYLELVDWTGRAILDGKRGWISDELPPILLRLQVNPDQWVSTVAYFNRCFPRMAGRIDRLKAICRKLNLAWVHGMGPSKRLFSQPAENMRV